MGLGLQRERAHVVHEQRDALLGQRGAEGVHGPEGRVELHQPVEILGRPGDTGILRRLLEGGGGTGWAASHWQQGPGHRVEPEQHGQEARTGARQTDDDPRALDPLVPHLGVLDRPRAGARCGWPARTPASSRRGSARRWSARPRPRTTAGTPRAARGTSRSRSRPTPPSWSAAFVTDAARRDGRRARAAAAVRPTQLRARSGRLRNSESRHVYSAWLTSSRPSRCHRWPWPISTTVRPTDRRASCSSSAAPGFLHGDPPADDGPDRSRRRPGAAGRRGSRRRRRARTG